jgi:hypothetical protein
MTNTERNAQLMKATTGATRLVTDYYVLPPVKVIRKSKPNTLG